MSSCSHQRGVTVPVQPIRGCQYCVGTTERLKAFHPSPTLSSNQRGLKCFSLPVESLFHPYVERAKHSGPGSLKWSSSAWVCHGPNGCAFLLYHPISSLSVSVSELCPSKHEVNQPYISVFPLRLLWGKGADFCSPMVILGKRLQTVVTSLSLQWEDAQIPWRYYKNVERRQCCIRSLSQKISPHDHLRMSLEVFDRHTVMICLEHYRGNTNSFISYMCMVPIGSC